MRDPIKIFMLLWLLCLTLYVVIGKNGEIGRLVEVGQRQPSFEEMAGQGPAMGGPNQSLPKTGGFKILHAPNGKWRLFRSDIWIADFETHAEAEIGMNLCINPEIQRYDDTGQRING